LLASPELADRARAATTGPNIVVIVTDDQRFDSMFSMPLAARLLAAHGITFTHAFASNALCCPARVSLLTGGYSHTTGIYLNSGRYGGWRSFHRSGGEEGTIAVDLDAAGYRTALVGKYLNLYDGQIVPPGWDVWAAFAGAKSGGAYYDYDLYVRDARGERTETHGHDTEDYSTSVIRRKSVRFISSTPDDVPLFLFVAPFAAHGPKIPAPRDVDTYAGYDQRLPPSFNERDMTDKPRYLQKLDPVRRREMLHRYQRQYETLQSVDRMIRAIVARLRQERRLRDTLLLFTSDQGVELGEHRWHSKMVPYEESIGTPMIIRYDAAISRSRRGIGSRAVIGNVDVAPTLADAAGISTTFDGVGQVDGRSMMPILTGSRRSIRSSVVLEHLDSMAVHRVPSFCGLRTRRFSFVRYETGEEELYRLRRDPYELQNVAGSLPARVHRLLRHTKRLCDPPPPGYTWS
jgi:arylsulfatase A-like enzyme